MSDRVVVMSAGPASRPIGEFAIDLARPRDVAEVRTTPGFIALHNAIWAVLRDEVLKGYQPAPDLWPTEFGPRRVVAARRRFGELEVTLEPDDAQRAAFDALLQTSAGDDVTVAEMEAYLDATTASR